MLVLGLLRTRERRRWKVKVKDGSKRKVEGVVRVVVKERMKKMEVEGER